MSSIVQSVTSGGLSLREAAETLSDSSTSSLRSRFRRMSRRTEDGAAPRIVVVEDSWVDFQIVERQIVAVCRNSTVIQHHNLHDAVKDVRDADLVIVDWNLSDGLNAQECGVLDFLKRKQIPHVVFTGQSGLDLGDTPVIHKNTPILIREFVRQYTGNFTVCQACVNQSKCRVES